MSDQWMLFPRRRAAGGGGGGDPYFANVILLTNNQGANNGTTFTDASPVGRTLTAAGNAITSTAQFKFGDSSAYFDGAGDYVDCNSGSNISIVDTTAWTEEFWFRPDESSYTGGITSLRRFQCLLNSGGDNTVVTTQYYSDVGSSRRPSGGADNNGSTLQGTSIDLVAGTWYFAQLVNDGTAAADAFKVYLGTSGTGTTIISTTRKGRLYRYFGAGGTPGLDYFKGYIGPVRLTSGVARANAIPTDLFPTS